MKHVYEWIDEPATSAGESLAKEWLNHFCLPAISKDYDWLNDRVLTCEYQGQRYRCTGASRMGDVWLAKDLKRNAGYDLRVDVAQCKEWELKLIS